MTTAPDREGAAVEDLAGLLAEHEARWTTHGYERTYDVIHCAGGCQWSLRQKVSMTDDACHDAHRAHVAAVIAAGWVPQSEVAERERAAAEKALRDAATAARQMTYPSSSDPDHWALWLDGRADRLGGDA